MLTWAKVCLNDQAPKVVVKLSHSAWKLVRSGIPEGHLHQ